MGPPAPPRPAPAPAGVVVAAADGGAAALAAADAAARELAAERLPATVAPLAEVLARTEPCAVVLAWFARAVDAEACARAASWAAPFRPRPGLITRAPRAAAGDAERALEAGFDDAVCGDCGTRELAARVRAVQRRVGWQRGGAGGRIRHGRLLLDVANHVAWVDGREIVLTSTERAVVRALVRAGGRTLTRDALLDEAWGDDGYAVSGRAVDNVMLRLRRKLGEPDLIETVRGVGFRLAPDE